MKELAIYLAETALCSVLLLVAYTLLLQSKTPFGWCRRTLLGILVLSVVIPALRIPVWPAQATTGPMVAPGDPTALIVGITDTPHPLRIGIAAGVLYLTGVVLLLGIMLRQALGVRRLAQGASITRENGLRIARVREPIAAFSFMNTIYLSDDPDKAAEQVVIAHEASHVRHRHSQERIIMEVEKALMWWNPVAWIAARRLVEVQEYEADRDVLAAGHDPASYADLLFRRLCGTCPDLTNGLLDSLTKKRFKMIDNYTSGGHALLRLTGMLAVTAGLVTAFSFTARAAAVPPEEHAEVDDIVVVAYPSQEETHDDPETKGMTLVQTDEGKAWFPLDQDGKMANEPGPAWSDLLLLLDGREITVEEFNKLDKNTIAVIDILKGETAVSRYGQRAKHGAILLTTQTEETTEETTQYGTVEQIALFGNSEDIGAFRTWVMERIRYPREAVRQGLQGRVIVQFTVSEQGELGDVAVLESPGASLTQEVVRVLATSPRWTPATTAGKPQAVRLTLPLEFRLSEQQSSPTMTETATQTHLCEDTACFDVDQMPAFQGGDLNRFRSWLGSNLLYPAQTQGGLVVAQFVIDTHGRVGDVQILRSPDQALSDEVVRVLESSPAWEPARLEGKPVRFSFTLPVQFAASVN